MFLKSLFLFLLRLSLFGLDLGEYEIKFHGRFCGDNIPNVHAKSKEEEYRLLSKMEPIDVIDAACKKHDLCYITHGDGSEFCDKELVESVSKLHDNLKSEDCRRFTQSIIYYFKTKNDNVFTLINEDGSVKDRVTKLPSTGFKNMAKTAVFSKMVSVNYGFGKPYGYIFDAKNNKQRRKEVLQIFPPRYKKCELVEEPTH